jgi:hypothetical protein
MEELDFGALLDRFKKDGFTRGEQVLLSNFGTNQTLLSIIFGVPNRLRLVDHREKDGEMVRCVNLYCGDDLVCIANSTLPIDKNRKDVLSDVAGGSLGLGQIVVKYNLPNRRVLLDVGRDKASFWRTYAIEGPEVYMKIHENFYREPFIKVGWDAFYIPKEVKVEIAHIDGLRFSRPRDIPLPLARATWKQAILDKLKVQGGYSETLPRQGLLVKLSIRAGEPFAIITMPCEQTLTYQTFEDIPMEDVLCPCGDPEHIAVHYVVLQPKEA